MPERRVSVPLRVDPERDREVSVVAKDEEISKAAAYRFLIRLGLQAYRKGQR